MRVVVDTNVFVSLLIRPGDSFVALADVLEQKATVLYSTDTLTELTDVQLMRTADVGVIRTPELVGDPKF